MQTSDLSANPQEILVISLSLSNMVSVLSKEVE